MDSLNVCPRPLFVVVVVVVVVMMVAESPPRHDGIEAVLDQDDAPLVVVGFVGFVAVAAAVVASFLLQ